jgi:uncharacterized lipoprotein YbaY
VIRVRGVAVVPAGTEPGTAARMLVEVRDAALADAPSVLLAAQVYERVPLRAGDLLPFALDVPDVPARAVLSLRVHVDVDGDGTVRAGDLLSTRFHPVPTAAAAAELVVPLTRMG